MFSCGLTHSFDIEPEKSSWGMEQYHSGENSAFDDVHG